MTDFLHRRAPAGVLVLALLAAAAPARAQTLAVDQWSIYGSNQRYAADPAVPGGGTVTIDRRAGTGEDWSSAASVPLPRDLKRGDRISATFWARADRAATLPAVLLARAKPYPAFTRSVVRLTPRWQRFTVTGTAPADMASGTQVLSLQLGKAGTNVALGPVLWMRGAPGPAEISTAFAAFVPASVAEDVRVPSDPATVLAATLRVPRGHGPGPFPVTLLLSGSGASKRGVFTLLADRLLAQGIATFEYDKRGVGQSTGEFVDTVAFHQADATAAVAYLRTRREIDGKRIALAGLSLGGVVGSAVAARDPAIAAVVMLAAPVGARNEPFMVGLRSRLAAGGHGDAVVGRVADAVQAWMEARVRHADEPEIVRLRDTAVTAFMETGATRDQARGMIATLDTPALLSMYQAGPSEDLAKIRAPVLAVFAGADAVLASDNVGKARHVLKDREGCAVIEIPAVTHVFQPVGDRPADEVQPAFSAPEVLEVVPKWLGERLRQGSTK